jgi:proteasome-associated ATPase
MPELSPAELAEKLSRQNATLQRAQEVIRKQQAEIEALTTAPNAVGIFQGFYDGETAIVSVGNREHRVCITEELRAGNALRKGVRVLLNDSQVIIGTHGAQVSGTTGKITACLDGGRVLVETGDGGAEVVLSVAPSLADAVSEVGMTVLVDPSAQLVLEVLRDADEVSSLWLEETPDVTYDDIGGLEDQLGKIRDTVELPYLHPGLFAAMHLAPPKGLLLYGPPGTGKTMIAKAVANQLANSKPGAVSHFLSVKGPELLDKFVGESERKIREIFDRARHLAKSGDPVVIFFDEMESVFRVRGSGVSSDTESTLVPQLLTELDGMEELHNVIVIGASNRQDLIDPALLRPGRLDVKIKVDRPDRDAAIDIFDRYLTPDLPYAAAHEVHGTEFKLTLGVHAADALYAKDADTEFLEVTYSKGTKETLHFGDFSSGAMIANIVARAKTSAIKDHLDGQPLGISLEHLKAAIREEFKETEDLPNTTSPEDWAKISGFKGEDIVRVRRVFREAHDIDTVRDTGQYL